PLLWALSFFFSSRRRHTRFSRDWSSDVCSSDLADLLGVSPTTIARWANSGKLAYMRTPAGHRRFSLEVIEQLRAPAEGGAVSSRSEERRVGKECRPRGAADP